MTPPRVVVYIIKTSVSKSGDDMWYNAPVDEKTQFQEFMLVIGKF